MEKIKKIIFDNYELNNEEKTLFSDILLSNNNNYEKIYSVILNLIKFRLDYDTILAFIAYIQDYDISGKVNEDTMDVYESLKFNFLISSSMSKNEQADILRKMFIAMNKDI